MFIGTYGAANNFQALQISGITHILCVSPSLRLQYVRPSSSCCSKAVDSVTCSQCLQVSGTLFLLAARGSRRQLGTYLRGVRRGTGLHRQVGLSSGVGTETRIVHSPATVPVTSTHALLRCANYSALATGGKVLVHCFMGRSRSATIVLAYLVARRGLALSEALRELRRVRPQAQPNTGFYKELLALEAQQKEQPEV
ncbi:hypothetical protein BBJ28_00010643 [Nothophytophthora sp. Chile5]|nr:hypothetical protein BBJ28_00010643 [Nothophytophthora sp. Chile5]